MVVQSLTKLTTWCLGKKQRWGLTCHVPNFTNWRAFSKTCLLAMSTWSPGMACPQHILITDTRSAILLQNTIFIWNTRISSERRIARHDDNHYFHASKSPSNHTFCICTQHCTNFIIMFSEGLSDTATAAGAVRSIREGRMMLMKFTLCPTPAPSRAPVNVHSAYLQTTSQCLVVLTGASESNLGSMDTLRLMSVKVDERITVLGQGCIESQWLDTLVEWASAMLHSLRCTKEAG